MPNEWDFDLSGCWWWPLATDHWMPNEWDLDLSGCWWWHQLLTIGYQMSGILTYLAAGDGCQLLTIGYQPIWLLTYLAGDGRQLLTIGYQMSGILTYLAAGDGRQLLTIDTKWVGFWPIWLLVMDVSYWPLDTKWVGFDLFCCWWWPSATDHWIPNEWDLTYPAAGDGRQLLTIGYQMSGILTYLAAGDGRQLLTIGYQMRNTEHGNNLPVTKHLQSRRGVNLVDIWRKIETMKILKWRIRQVRVWNSLWICTMEGSFLLQKTLHFVQGV